MVGWPGGGGGGVKCKWLGTLMMVRYTYIHKRMENFFLCCFHIAFYILNAANRLSLKFFIFSLGQPHVDIFSILLYITTTTTTNRAQFYNIIQCSTMRAYLALSSKGKVPYSNNKKQFSFHALQLFFSSLKENRLCINFLFHFSWVMKSIIHNELNCKTSNLCPTIRSKLKIN